MSLQRHPGADGGRQVGLQVGHGADAAAAGGGQQAAGGRHNGGCGGETEAAAAISASVQVRYVYRTFTEIRVTVCKVLYQCVRYARCYGFDFQA